MGHTAKQPVVSHGHSQRSAYERVRGMIINGSLSPGSWIIETDLAARLGHSRTPIRGALQLLQQEGYVIATSNTASKNRMLVAPLTQEDAQELYTILGHLEGLSARLTAELPQAKRNAAVTLLRGFNSGLAELAKARHSDAKRIFELDLNFHRTVVEASAGPRLLELHRTVQPQAERYWRLYSGAILDELGQSISEHDVIIRAIGKGNADKAESGIQTNWQNGAARLARVIQTLGERGKW